MKRSDANRIERLSWDDVEASCLELCEMIVRPVSMVMPVARGGLVPAAIIAYRLNLPIAGVITPGGFLSSRSPEILVVDDISDSGVTFRRVREAFPNAVYVAPYAKPLGASLCDHYAVRLSSDVWAEFAWSPGD